MIQDNRLAEALAQCQEDDVRALVHERIAADVPISDIVAECNRGMVELGNRFASGECFIPELMFGGMIMKSVMAELTPLMEGQPAAAEPRGKVVIGSVQYDVHDIGKEIVTMMLRGVGFQVIDLGVDVPPEVFVEAVREHQPRAVGMSVLLTTCFKSVVATMDAIRAAQLRDKVSVMVGGAAASQMLCENAGCDFYARTAVDGMHYACSLVPAT
jgi:5-methyltetrahydrofolate--homocysteine methyltransferase